MSHAPVDPARRLDELATALGQALRAQHLTLATAESCTAGGVAYAVTLVPGSSAWFDRGFVTYTNAAKMQVLGVAPAYLRDYGAVSEPVARAMALGALQSFNTDVSVGITGIAGPGGGTPEKPVGLVYICAAHSGGLLRMERNVFSGSRSEIRQASASRAMEMLMTLDG